MPDVISFDEAIERTKGEDRALLIGNGFSAKYFTYASLLEASDLEEGSPSRNLFERLETADFEAVVRALESAVVVEQAFKNEDHAEELRASAQKVREALVAAVQKTHPAHREDLEYTVGAKFLANFASVFSLNYDLLLYWLNLEARQLRDGFGLGEDHGSFRGPFREDAHCHIFNLHGGLHLFDNGAGEMQKALHTGDGVIATIAKTIVEKRRLPIYVAEGTSGQKMRKINSVHYLRHCYDQLRRNGAAIFVYGHSADENDAHIYRAIFGSEAKHLFFGVYQPDEEKLRHLDGALAKYQKSAGSSMEYTFFASETASVWPS